jgi:YidC/Oxa1 family membrane protein insertase
LKKWVVNNSKKDISLMTYTKIKRDVTTPSTDTSSYQGPVIVHENSMKEVDYAKIKKSGGLNYIEDGKHCEQGQHNWAGFSDKYWLSAVLFDCNFVEKVSFRAYANGDRKYIQSDILENSILVDSGKKSVDTKSYVYLGPKDISALDDYSEKYNIKLFDKSIDFGMFYFLTKPILLMLRFIHKFVDNYGLAIIFLTIIIRIIMLPLGNKSYRMMSKMKTIQPKVEALKSQFGDDKMAMNKAMIDLYKKEQVNPFATFIPILIQIPIFFALYKVLYISIEIRQSPFIWWIRDLSAPDPTSIFNLFGLLPFGLPGFLQVGILPILVGLTMWLQQIMSYSGPTNEYTKVMKYMPIFFTFLFASFPAGLMIYWTINNLFSIINQYLVAGKK